ncbi:MAG: DNA-directed RNA polymerase subunit beta' [Candidatus Harrisonbacteria bacterium RIFCSPHIGHO2_01_FULL_44_13]|nr:MAG: DNA-directed RNA polymerase subunit beta' [Candidatus Harrisonbacteria bacterium RIFCSPHIGHO2_01_FULL_44_13]
MDFDAIKLKIASPEEITRWSHGEVIKPETINYRTQRPEKDGLFSERIFGPSKDWECYCGKYRRIRYKGIICDKCGVEVTRSVVRRERMGHIKLAVPVAHIWFLRSAPSKISLFLDVPLPKLEKVIYYAAYIVTSVNENNKKRALDELEKEFQARKKTARKEGVKMEELKAAATQTRQDLESVRPGRILSESEFYNLARRFGDVFEAGTGAGAVRRILEGIDLKDFISEIKKKLKDFKDPISEQRLLRRLKLASLMLKDGMRPEWIILTVLPVLPPDLRPMVALDGGRYATSDLNDLYRRVINRNNRLKKLMEIRAPEVILVNEKRMLQEAVDALVDNSARFGVQQMSAQRRPLRSLADMLKGKQGRFRQNLLGKRVDYSGRSVIVIGPELRISECGLPKKMALELFKPFVINKVIERGLAHNIRNSNRLIEQAPPEIWAILEEVIADRKVLLNRAPTLHRLGVQAFKPLLIEDLAIRVPALICTAFNADFDGDQMAVHLPLTKDGQKEASQIMLSSLNLLKPSTGDPIAVPTQDIVLGCYYLTKIHDGALGTGRAFGSNEEAKVAYELGIIEINALIKIGKLETSVGRLLFNEVLPADFEYVNEGFDKKRISKMVGVLINKYGQEKSSEYLNAIKNLGFEYATRSGITWSMDDLVTPKEKTAIVKKAEEEVALIKDQFEQGLLTESERRARVIESWRKANDHLNKKIVPVALDPHSPVYSIIDSGARGSWSQPGQMMGMKGLVQNPKGETIELPVKSSLKEGFSVLEYFISTHGARKGSTDTALKTASAGYLTRRLVDVSQDLVIKEQDCRTAEGIDVPRGEGLEFGHTFASRLFSRTCLEDVKVGNKILARAGETIDRAVSELIESSKVDLVKIRSPLTCKTLYGLCSKCYGFDLGKNYLIKIGEAVGVVAAQSIGEPGTQLTMRTFHTGGVAGADITHGLPRVEELFEVRSPQAHAFMAEEDGIIDVIEEKGSLKIIKVKAKSGRLKKAKIFEYPVSRTTEIFFKVNDAVKKGDQLCEGHLDLKELFGLGGTRAVERYIIKEVQKIYLSEGASINNKHLEIIIRQMFSRIKIKDSGDSDFVAGDVLEKSKFLEANRQIKKSGGQPATGLQLLMGITKVALSTESFLSAASFQETARVLINAATEGKVDILRGLKENVIIGRKIPVGTGLKKPEEKGID